MKKNSFDWDKYFSTVSLNEIREKSPVLRQFRPPSVLLEDEQVVYFSSIDIGVDLKEDDVVLKSYLSAIIKDIKEAFKDAQEFNFYYKMACASDDFEIVKMLLEQRGTHFHENLDDSEN